MGFELLRGSLPDGDLQYSSRLIMQIEEWVNRHEPAIVITHDYDPAGIDHQDHIAVARAVLNVAHCKPEIELVLQVEPSRGSRSFEPNAFVDVTEFAARKLAAIACHKSQAHKDYLQPHYVKCGLAGGPRFPAGPPRKPEAKCMSKPSVLPDGRSSALRLWRSRHNRIGSRK